MNKFAIIGMVLFVNAESSNFKFKICENGDENRCVRADSAITIESINCTPENGKCKITAKCNASISFDKVFTNSLSDSNYMLRVPIFNYTYCKEDETLLIDAECTKNGCINHDKFEFTDMQISYINKATENVGISKIDVKRTKKPSEFDVIIQSSEKGYHNPQMTCAIIDNGKIITRKVYRIDFVQNGKNQERIEMMKSQKQYRIINIMLPVDWQKGKSINCVTYEYNKDDPSSKYFSDYQ